MTDARPWMYFGCRNGEAGHYLTAQGKGLTYDQKRPFEKFDGALCYPEKDGLYVASLSRLGGLGYSALAFWDRTVDKRPGSNLIFFAPSLTITARDLMQEAALRFPQIVARLPAIDLRRAEGGHVTKSDHG